MFAAIKKNNTKVPSNYKNNAHNSKHDGNLSNVSMLTLLKELIKFASVYFTFITLKMY